ncbi:MAG: hypothetical protein ACLRMJ_12055 [Alistipes finegoldii]
MAGSGVNPSNVRQLAATGVDALHFSARHAAERHGIPQSADFDGRLFRRAGVRFALCRRTDHPTNPERIKPMKRIFLLLLGLSSAPAAVTAAVFPPNTNPARRCAGRLSARRQPAAAAARDSA